MNEKIFVLGFELKAAACEVCPGNLKIYPASDLPMHHALKHSGVVMEPQRQGKGGRAHGKEKPGQRMSATGVEHTESIHAA